jgi:hypothetical protein
MPDTLMRNFQRIANYIKEPGTLSEERMLLLGACFTMEYSIESAALFNPSIVVYPKQNGTKKGQIDGGPTIKNLQRSNDP